MSALGGMFGGGDKPDVSGPDPEFLRQQAARRQKLASGQAGRSSTILGATDAPARETGTVGVHTLLGQ